MVPRCPVRAAAPGPRSSGRARRPSERHDDSHAECGPCSLPTRPGVRRVRTARRAEADLWILHVTDPRDKVRPDGAGIDPGIMSRVDDLDVLVASWPVDRVSAGVTDPAETLGVSGEPDRLMHIASVGKLFVGMA